MARKIIESLQTQANQVEIVNQFPEAEQVYSENLKKILLDNPAAL